MQRLVLLLALILLAAAPALAEDVRVGDIVISGAWGRPSIGSGPGAVYFTLRNEGSAPDRLVGVVSPAAGMAMLHESYTEDGISKMRMLDAVELPPGQTVTLAPAGLHLMLTDLAAPLKQGQAVSVELTFEKAGPVRVEARVGKLGAKGP
jgi:periplasmic copper chaperone A